MIASRTVLALAAVLVLGGHAEAQASATDSSWYKEPNVNATWSEASIAESDGTTLHVDVLRPAGLKATDKTPVILSEGPYFNHSGQVGALGPAAGAADYDPVGPPGPSRRFQDFVVGARLMQKGYTFVMVDLRGYGGSTGCLDFAGPGEQADVKAGVEWAAAQPWSTGKVGMYGKSYDALTGVMAIAQQPEGLAAVVAQEPTYREYDYLYANGVRFKNSLATPAAYIATAGSPGQAMDSPGYLASSVGDLADPGCAVDNLTSQALDNDPGSPFWRARDLVTATRGKTTPTFLTQGFLEDNTKPEGAWDFFGGLAGPKRGWFGMWDHVRGNETAEGVDDTPLWFAETMRFFDRYVAGRAPTTEDPPVEVQTEDGRWRGEAQWPPADSVPHPVALRTGTYLDDAQTDGSAIGAGTLGTDTPGAGGIWTFSPALRAPAHLSGVPRVRLDLAPSVGAADTNGSADLTDVNVAVDVYDVGPAGSAILLSRTAALVPESGKLDLAMYGNDWHIVTGHRVGVLVTSSNSEWYLPTPSLDTVTVRSASIDLPFLTTTRATSYAVKTPKRLGTWLRDAPFTIPAATIAAGTSPAFVPPPTADGPVVATGPAGARLTVRLAVKRGGRTRRIHVSGTTARHTGVLIHLLRNGEVVGTRRVKTTTGTRYAVDFTVRRSGRYAARAGTTSGATKLKTTSRTARVHVLRG